MRKLVTVLMIVLPLLFLVAVFAITGAAADRKSTRLNSSHS